MTLVRSRLVPFLFAAGLLCAQRQPGALDKSTLEAYVRHLLLWPAVIKVDISDPVPGPLPGFSEMRVTGSASGRTQTETFYISADGAKIVHGDVFDLQESPFRTIAMSIAAGDLPVIGPATAPVTIVEFADFECPYCREEAGVLKDQLLAAYPGQIRLAFSDFPLEQVHPWAKAAAIAGRCVFRPSNEAFWKYHDWVFAHQKEITPGNFAEKLHSFVADTPAVKLSEFQACTASPATAQEVGQIQARGTAAQIDNTPTFFINGRRMVGTVSLESLRLAIDSELAFQRKRSGTPLAPR